MLGVRIITTTTTTTSFSASIGVLGSVVVKFLVPSPKTLNRIKFEL